jgi:catalase
MKNKTMSNAGALKSVTFKRTKYTMITAMALMLLFASFYANAQDKKTQATPTQMVDALHAAFGKHTNGRAVHAKGLFFEGDFTPAPGAKQISSAPHLQSFPVPVTVRFSDFTGIPDISDTIGASNPRGMAIKFHLPDGKITDIIAHSFNGFPVATTDKFRTFLLDISKSGPDAPHPNAIEQFLGTHPIAKTFLTTQKPPSVSYATLTYFGVNSFRFTNSKGKSTFIRYQIIPETGDQFLTAEEFKNSGSNYLSEEMKIRITKGPVKFKLYAQLAEKNDVIDDPSIAWPDERKRVFLGTITVTRYADNSLENDKALIYNPGNLPIGIAIADPMIADRAKAYPISVKERQQ